ncbi:MAG: hypothetical protein ACJ76J_10415, partial [Thermoanaerobaculia bacterium]
MALKLQVPAIYAPILGDLLKLSPEAMKDLLSSLQEVQPTLAVESLAELLAERLPLDARKTRGIVELLSSLNVAREGLGADQEEFIAELRSAMERSDQEELHTSDWTA